MKKAEISSYKDNAIAGKWKAILANLADYLVTMVLTTLIYVFAASPILASLPTTSGLKSEIKTAQTALNQIASDTHLQLEDKNGKLIKTSEMANEFALTYAKTSYYLNEAPFPYEKEDGKAFESKAVTKSETFLEDNYENDPIGYYFYVFKSKEPDLAFYVYDGIDYSKKKDEFFFLNASGLGEDGYADFFIEKTTALPLYRQLSLDKAKLLVDYMIYKDKGKSSSDVYSKITSSFNKSQKFFASEVETSFRPYQTQNQKIQFSYRKLSSYYFIDFVAAYVIGFLINEFLLPIILKNKRTIGLFSFKLGYQTLDDRELGPKNLLSKGGARFLIQFSSIFLSSILFNMEAIFFVRYGSFFSFSLIILFSALLGIASLVSVLIGKKHQGFAELVSFTIVKDTQEFEAPIKTKEDNGSEKRTGI